MGLGPAMELDNEMYPIKLVLFSLCGCPCGANTGGV